MPTGDPRTGEIWTTGEGHYCRVYRDHRSVTAFFDTNPDPLRTPWESFDFRSQFRVSDNVPCDLFGDILHANVRRDRSYAFYALERLAEDTGRDPAVHTVSDIIIGILANIPEDPINVNRLMFAFAQAVVAELNLDRDVLLHFRIEVSPHDAVQHPEDVRVPVSPRILAALLKAAEGLPDRDFFNALSPSYRAAWRQAALGEALQREQESRQEAPTLWDRLDET
jgi:hypothetical protein